MMNLEIFKNKGDIKMKDNYDISIKLRCIVCGMEDCFECNEDKSYIKCSNCGKEYFGGYDELVECNQQEINSVVESKKDEIAKDLKKDIEDMFKNAFKGSNFIKIK
jgi:cytochrome c-type biogenesis protein CcmH/NrfF